mmetsp:Transcript_15869/g.47702  ORF Transcript_15869/g.47702 Transcript_15869/m.47702 type:complete len:261 (+) Transcript_15869:884-1666(+)
MWTRRGCTRPSLPMRSSLGSRLFSCWRGSGTSTSQARMSTLFSACWSSAGSCLSTARLWTSRPRTPGGRESPSSTRSCPCSLATGTSWRWPSRATSRGSSYASIVPWPRPCGSFCSVSSRRAWPPRWPTSCAPARRSAGSPPRSPRPSTAGRRSAASAPSPCPPRSSPSCAAGTASTGAALQPACGHPALPGQRPGAGSAGGPCSSAWTKTCSRRGGGARAAPTRSPSSAATPRRCCCPTRASATVSRWPLAALAWYGAG